jgi:iron complex transport system ATP-binding protein
VSFELRFDGVTVKKGAKTVLAGVSLRVKTGEFVALIGPNGGGKTTLLRAAVGLESPNAGRVSIEGKDVARMTPRARASKLAWLPQQALVNDLLPVLDVVTSARYRFSETHAESREAALSALRVVETEHLGPDDVTALSGGEQQRVALATLLAQDAAFLLVDEPANHLDPAQQMRIYVLLGQLWRRGLGVLCVTHDINLLRFLPETCPVRLVGLKGGSVSFDVSYDAASLEDELSELFGVTIRAVKTSPYRLHVAEPPPVCHGTASVGPKVS